MGRKIPAKKHRGVKDPIEQQARRLQSLKSKINAPPSDPDEQPVPRSLTRLFAFQHPRGRADKPNLHKNAHKLISGDGDGRGVGDNPISSLRKLPGESGRGFSLRINSAVRALHGGGAPLDYPQDEEEEDSRGARMADLRSRRARKQRRAASRRPLPAAAPAPAPAPPATRTQKLALKKKAKKEKADEVRRERREVVYERVPFGDVTHAPPALRPLGPAGPGGGAARPGRRGLLLSALLQGGGGGATPPAGAGAEARRRERARLDAVNAYRALKAAKARSGNKPA